MSFIRDHTITLLTSSPLPSIITEPSPAQEVPDESRTKRLKTARNTWESEDGTDEDILDQFLKVKRFADHQLPSYESKSNDQFCYLQLNNHISNIFFI